jgi:LEA14-like dessication related protein
VCAPEPVVRYFFEPIFGTIFMPSRCLLSFFAFIVLAAGGCASLSGRDPPNVSVAGVEALKGEGLELRLAVKLRVQNPNDAAIDYDGAYVQLNVEGHEFASGVSSEHGTVPRYGESIVTIAVTAPAIRMAIGALRIINGQYRGKIDYDLQGKLNGPTFSTVRFTSKGQVDLEK